MKLSRRNFVVGGTLALGHSLLRAENSASPPAPYGALPSANQVRWAQLETYAFLHFTVNTFTDREWGLGDEDPNVFSPTDFNADAIVSDLKKAGMKAVILTCKHHDGFCLWPTKTTEHSVKYSSWQGGKGDVVRDISEAARRQDLRFGVYVSPWDRNNAHYGKPEYLPIYRGQLTELLSNYGPIFEVWFDGANGGDGYYGGAREKRTIGKNYYEWPKTIEIVRRLQPGAVIFGDDGDIRWIGNEKGFANETCWATYNEATPSNITGTAEQEAVRGTGDRNGRKWMPAECDVSIRPGWFYHAREDDKVRTPDNLLDLYFKSVGRGASLLLNFPPDREGRISAQDAHSGAEFHRRIEEMFQHDLAKTAKLHASNVRGGMKEFAPEQLIDGDRTTYWATDDAVHTPGLTVDFPAESQVSAIRLREVIALGQRIGAVEIDAWKGSSWSTIAHATSIGSCRLIRLDQPVRARRLRLRITDSPVSIALAEFGVF